MNYGTINSFKSHEKKAVGFTVGLWLVASWPVWYYKFPSEIRNLKKTFALWKKVSYSKQKKRAERVERGLWKKSVLKLKTHSLEIMDHDLISDLSQKIMIPWSGSWKSHDPDQKLADFFLIRIKNWPIFFIRIKKMADFFFYPDKKLADFFCSGSKIGRLFFDPDQKMADFFFDPDQKMADFFLSGS